MFTFDSVILQIVLRTAIIYVIVLIGLRLSGKREVGQMTPFDLVLLLLISNAVQNAMTGPDTSITGGIAAAVTLFAMNALASRLVWKNLRIRKALQGTPTLLIHNGSMIMNHLDREHISREALDQALREHGVASASEVYTATLEIDGSISVLKKDELPGVTRPHHHIRFINRKNM